MRGRSSALVIIILVIIGLGAYWYLSRSSNIELPFIEVRAEEPTAPTTTEAVSTTITEPTYSVQPIIDSKLRVWLMDKQGNEVKVWESPFASIFHEGKEVAWLCFRLTNEMPFIVKVYVYVLPGSYEVYTVTTEKRCVWLRSLIPNKDGKYVLEVFAEAVDKDGSVKYVTPHLKITLESKKDKVELPIKDPPEVEVPEPNTLYMVVTFKSETTKACHCCPGFVYIYVNGTKIKEGWCGGEWLTLKPRIRIEPGKTYKIEMVMKPYQCHGPMCDKCDQMIRIYATANPKKNPPSHYWVPWEFPPTKVIGYYKAWHKAGLGTKSAYVVIRVLPNYDIEVIDTDMKWGDGETIH